MSRYVNDIKTSKSTKEVEDAVNNYMSGEGFGIVDYKGEKVWKKGLGIMIGPQYLKVEPKDGNVHIEGWIQWALLPGVYVGEMGTKGALGAIPKRQLRKRVEQVEELIK